MVTNTMSPRSRRLTAKQELFLLRLFVGDTQRAAYITAYHPPKSSLTVIDVCASRLANQPKMLLRLAELRQKARDDSVSTVLERKQKLTEIQRATVADFVDEFGNLSILSKGQLKTPAVAEIKTERTLVGVRTTLKLRDPIAAIQEHNRMERIGADNPSPGQDNRVVNFVFILPDGIQVSPEALALVERVRNGNTSKDRND